MNTPPASQAVPTINIYDDGAFFSEEYSRREMRLMTPAGPTSPARGHDLQPFNVKLRPFRGAWQALGWTFILDVSSMFANT